MHKVLFGKRATVYSGVANLREMLLTEITAKRNENAGDGIGSDDSRTITAEELESGNLGTCKSGILVTGKFND